jgi:hypothetical protein
VDITTQRYVEDGLPVPLSHIDGEDKSEGPFTKTGGQMPAMHAHLHFHAELYSSIPLLCHVSGPPPMSGPARPHPHVTCKKAPAGFNQRAKNGTYVCSEYT